MFDILIAYLIRSSFITKFVLIWLSIYFIITFAILISRMLYLKSVKARESKALEAFLVGKIPSTVNSALRKCLNGKISKEKLGICVSSLNKEATKGLSWLSIIASTSPFIGLFGTVVGILETFSKLSGSSVGLGVIAPAISEALVATGAGIFVAIPAYTFYNLIKREIYELMLLVQSEVDILVIENKDSSTQE